MCKNCVQKDDCLHIGIVLHKLHGGAFFVDSGVGKMIWSKPKLKYSHNVIDSNIWEHL